MKITEALKAIQQADGNAPPYRVTLACGFTPLHLQTFLAAHLQQRLPDRRVTITTGLYGDLAGTLHSLRAPAEMHGVAVALEWFDLDPRLGHRGEGTWGPAAIADIVTVARMMLGRMAAGIEGLPADLPVAVSLPTLPATPVFHTPGGRLSEAQLELERMVLDFGARIVRRRDCAVVNRERLAEESAPSSRFDLKSDLLTGLPYSLPHADVLAAALARLLAPSPPKKGIITDLDDTLWRGILGEIGADKVCWDMAGHCQMHGLYQQLLSALAEEGVLIGIASKNDPAVVKQAFERDDLRLRESQVFPMEVSWNAKSGAVERILRAWNVGADSVVFVDDSPMELAEVAAAHPGIECILFPKDDHAGAYAMFRRLRDLFGKPRVSEEDAIRLESLRQGAAYQESIAGVESPELFLKQAGAVVTIDWTAADDPRVLELVNKTNQFNLNGLRYTAADWSDLLFRPGAWLGTVSYLDKFGPLGKIGVLQGYQKNKDTLYIKTWVMSCRAFSRRVEYQCLKILFNRYEAQELVFDFKPTPKNGPLRDFIAAVTGSQPAARFSLTRAEFEKRCPPLYHQVSEGSAAWIQSTHVS